MPRKILFAAFAVALRALLASGPVDATCNAIPGPSERFRGALALLDRPYVRPGDVLELRLDPTCHGASAGLGAATDRLAVTLVFTPPQGPRNVVVLRDQCWWFAAEQQVCERTLGGGRATCIPIPGGLETTVRDGVRRLRVPFPDTDALLASADLSVPRDGIGLAGPVTIAVTSAVEPPPCELATRRCRDVLGLLACADELFENDGSCDLRPDPVFPHLTALPAANDFGAVCTQPAPPCTGREDAVRMAVDAAGNLLVPMDWRGVLVRRGDVPVARLLEGTATVSAFPDRDVPLHLSDARLLGSFSLQGTRLPPLLSVQGALIPEGLALFGSADAPEGVLRIGRGATCPDGASCRDDRDCAEGRCEGVFDFASRAFGGVGPVVLQDGACLGGQRDRSSCAANADCPGGSCVILSAAARDPVPLDGLVETDPGYAFVVSESLVQEDRNGDGDTLDDVVQLVDRETGAVQPASPLALGSAVARIHEAPFSRPALAVAESLVAFLEPEPAAGHIDRNRDGDAADTLLRVLRVEQGGLVDLGPDQAVVADAAPLIDGAPLAASDGLVAFRTPEAFAARRRTGVFTVGTEGPPLTRALAELVPLSMSDDGRWFAIVTSDSGGRPDDSCEQENVGCQDAFLLDRDPDENGRFDDAPTLGLERASDASTDTPSDRGVSAAVVSGDGNVVAFVSRSRSLVPNDNNDDADAFVWDRTTGIVERVSVDGAGREAVDGVVANPRSLALSHDGQVVAFASRSGDLVPGDTNAAEDVFVRDRRAGTIERVSIASDGRQGDGRSFVPNDSAIALSADGTRVAFDSEAATLVPEDRNEARDVFVRDRVAGWTRRVSVGVEAEEANGPSSQPALSADGEVVAFLSAATNLVPGVARSVISAYVRELGRGSTTMVTRASDGAPGEYRTQDVALSRDGRRVAFATDSATLVPDDTNAMRDVFVHDRITGITERASLAHGDAEIPKTDSGAAGGLVALDHDGGRVAFIHTLGADHIGGSVRRGLIREPHPADVAADLNGDGDHDDTFLRVLDTRGGGTPVLRTLCPAGAVAAAAGRLAFLRPEAAGEAAGCPAGPDLNADGDGDDQVVHLADASGAVMNLGVAASAVALSREWIAALVPESAEGGRDLNGDGDADDRVVHVRSLTGDASWSNLGVAADQMSLRGSVLVVRVDEAAQREDRNGDGDRDDHVVQTAHLPAVVLGGPAVAAEDMVSSDTLLAMRVAERAQGNLDANGDGDATDDVLFVVDLASDEVHATGQAVTPCRLEACDPRVPYRVLRDTVRFLTFEADQSRDLNGDGDVADLVLQVFNARAHAGQAARAQDGSPATAAVLAAVVAGRCTTSGSPCATSEGCEDGGRCIVPPGRCLAPTGSTCRPGAGADCAADEWCVGSAGIAGSCMDVGAECSQDAECAAGSSCVGAGQSVQRLAAPLAAPEAAVIGAGICLDATERSQGSCRSAADCPAGSRCVDDVVTASMSDRDGDELPDAADVCPDVADPLQRDTDRDGIGDACDSRTCGNAVREAGELCDGTDDAGCPGQCRSDCTCRCTERAGKGTRVRFGLGRDRRGLAARIPMRLPAYAGEPVVVRIDDAAGNAIVSGGVGSLAPLGSSQRRFAARGRGAGLRTVELVRTGGTDRFRVELRAVRWLPRDRATRRTAARLTVTVGDRCVAVPLRSKRRRFPRAAAAEGGVETAVGEEARQGEAVPLAVRAVAGVAATDQ